MRGTQPVNASKNDSATKLAIALQPGLLGLDWAARLDTKVRSAARGARSVTFIGQGSSYNVALWASWLARQASGGALPARALTTWDFLADPSALKAPSSDLFVVISHRGDRDLTRRTLATIGRRHRVLICAEGAPAARHPVIRTSPPETSSAHTMSVMGAMAAAAELIASALGGAKARTLRDARTRAATLLQELSLESEELNAALGGLLTRGAGLHFVGGGPFHAVAHELALKAQEIAHIPAHAYGIEEFLHGPVTAVNEDDTVVTLSPQSLMGLTAGPVKPGTAKLLYLDRLVACRKASEAVSALVLEPSWTGPSAREAHGLPAAWQAVLALCWGQILCLSNADAWGINPDLNRKDDPRYEEAHRRARL